MTETATATATAYASRINAALDATANASDRARQLVHALVAAGYVRTAPREAPAWLPHGEAAHAEARGIMDRAEDAEIAAYGLLAALDTDNPSLGDASTMETHAAAAADAVRELTALVASTVPRMLAPATVDVPLHMLDPRTATHDDPDDPDDGRITP